MTCPYEASVARHDWSILHGTSRLTLGIGHHGAPRLRSTLNRVHEGRDQTVETLTQAPAPTSLRLKEME